MSRVQLALSVADLESSVEFYTGLLGVAPHKRRPGYANFAVEDPALKLVLLEVPAEQRGTGTAGALNHLGIEVADTGAVDAARARIQQAGLASFDEDDTTCCYARQDKVWVHDPHAVPWEVYTITDDDPAGSDDPAGASPGASAGTAPAAGDTAPGAGDTAPGADGIATGACCAGAAS